MRIYGDYVRYLRGQGKYRTLPEKNKLTDNRDWHLVKARQSVRSDAMWQSKIIACLYRPFDRRYCYFSEVAMDYPRVELRQHMLRPNISLNVTRQTKADQWRHALVANTPTPAIFTEVKDGSNVFPLYLYPNKSELPGLEEPSTSHGGRRPNLSPSFIAAISAKLNIQFIPDGVGDLQETVGPENIFG